MPDPKHKIWSTLKPKEAISFFRDKLALPTRAWNDLLGEAHERAFVVAGATEAALLADFQSAILEALEEGTTLQEFRKRFDTIVQKHGWDYKGGRDWRSEVIYDTNLRSAYAAGRYKEFTDPEVLAMRPYWMYRHGGSIQPRLEHLSWDGLVLPADDPFWATHTPPNGFGCSCTWFALSERDMEDRGLDVGQAPEPRTYEWTNRKTGEIQNIPVGIDPGWQHPPGVSLARDVTQQAMQQMPRALAAVFAAHVIKIQKASKNAKKIERNLDLPDAAAI